MRAYASFELKEESLSTSAQKYANQRQQVSPNKLSDGKNQDLHQCRSSIRGVVGQAISFFSHNNLSQKIKPKRIFQTTIKQIFDINLSKRQKSLQPFGLRGQMMLDQDEKEKANQNITLMKQTYRKSKYFAFERLMKLNSQSYGAYHKWLRQKKRLFPAMIKVNKNSFSYSTQQQEDQKMIKLQSEQKAFKKVQRLLRKDVKLYEKQKQLLSESQEKTLQYLFVTRTNLINKTNPPKQISNSKKLPLIKYPEVKNKIYKYFLGPGNNHEIIKKVFEETRSLNWVETSQYDTLFNLKWEQYTDKSIYSRLDFNRYRQLINHFQFHQSISTKIGLVETLKQYLAKTANNAEVFQYIPITFTFDWSDISKFEDELKKFVYFYCKNSPDAEKISKLEKEYVALSRSIWKQAKSPPNMSFDKNMFKKVETLNMDPVFKDNISNQYLWILKPNQLNRGRGIKIFSTLEQLAEIIKEDNLYDTFVVQKYIEKPLLVSNRKFDVRVWVLSTDKGDSYFFEEGYIRTSCENFCLDNQNQYIHLTNNAVQKHSKKYGIFQEGNQMSFDSINEHLGKQKGYFKQKWLPEIKKICSLVLAAGLSKMIGEDKVKHNLNSLYLKQTYRVRAKNNQFSSVQTQETANSQKCNLPAIQLPVKANNLLKQPNCSIRKGTFQIFGFDYMIDSEEKVWLIEVNTNPCLEMSSKIVQILIPRMIDDAFKIVLDPLFKLSCKYQKSLYAVNGYQDNQNMWTTLNKKTNS